MNTPTPPLLASLRQSWNQRSSSEQRALRLLFIVIIVAIAAQAVWSLISARQTLQRQLPGLAEQAAQATALSAKLRQLKSPSGDAPQQPATAPSPVPATADAVLAGSKDLGAGIRGQRNEGDISLKGDVDFGLWLHWLARVHDEQRWHPVKLRVTTQGAAPGRVSIDAVLRPATTTP